MATMGSVHGELRWLWIRNLSGLVFEPQFVAWEAEPRPA